MTGAVPSGRSELHRERERLLRQLAAALDKPMTFLAFVWLGLLVLDLTRGLNGWLSALNNLIWGLFVAHFSLEFVLAPDKWRYLRRNWLTAVALVLPALRVFRVFRAFRALRAARAARGTGVLRIVTSLNRGMGALRKALRRRGFGYVTAATALVTFAGAAGMYSFENPSSLRDQGYGKVADAGGGLSGYGEAVWWTAMTMTTMGADYFPKTPEGRLLGWLLAVYAFAVFGYITATIASYFVDRDRETKPSPAPKSGAGADGLRAEVAALRAEIAALAEELRVRSRPDGGRPGPTSG
jgi:voltage-gated potassium channel